MVKEFEVHFQIRARTKEEPLSGLWLVVGLTTDWL